jgi:hypothetical protein
LGFGFDRCEKKGEKSATKFVPRFNYHKDEEAHKPTKTHYDYGSRENSFVPRRFGYGPRPHRGNRFSCRPGFPAGESYTHFEPRHLNGPRSPRRGSRPNGSKSDVQNTVKTSSSHTVTYWIPKIYLTKPSTEPSTSSRPM